MAMSEKLGKVFYALLFCFLLPMILILWAKSVHFELPVFKSLLLGWLLTVVGLVMVLVSMAQLWFTGKGLPMNAYPPKYHVGNGLYFLFKHPIYIGFCLTCFGVSILWSSASGFYLISPVVSLLCLALVQGYENHSLLRLFPELKNQPQATSVSFSDKLKVILPVFLFWSFGYEILVQLGYDHKFVNTVSSFERDWRVIEWAEIPYSFTYLFVFVAPWLVKEAQHLDYFKKTSWWIIISGLLTQVLLPLYAAPRNFEPHTTLGDLIMWERAMDSPAAAFPSFHVLWILTVSVLLYKVYPQAIWLWIFIGGLLVWSCMATGAHSLLDVLGAILVFVIIAVRFKLWIRFQSFCEALANSWRSWRVGSVRIISHVWYSALAALLGTFMVGQILNEPTLILIVVGGAWLGGMVWGQWVEGSSRLLRPFGYFGAILGGVLTSICISFFTEVSTLTLLAAFALAAPWTQAIGRLRCLVQGCCHGTITNTKYLGICYNNPHSRVVAISNLKGVLVHNAQGYSILFNLLIGFLLLRFWYGGATSSVLAGLYFILAGCSRFVEEAYRGEIQTNRVGSLSIYQWLSILSIATGAFLTTLPGSTLIMSFTFSLELTGVSLFAGLIWAIGMSIDFPNSKLPFSRLTG
jgi:hypothetical protein